VCLTVKCPKLSVEHFAGHVYTKFGDEDETRDNIAEYKKNACGVTKKSDVEKAPFQDNRKRNH
jgi:hypothetical protein